MSNEIFYMEEFQEYQLVDSKQIDQVATVEGGLSNAIDLMFVLDITGSMDPYIEMVKHAIKTLVQQLPSKKTLRVGLVRYRDYKVDLDGNYLESAASCCTITDFTSPDKMLQVLAALRAGGGGDVAEALTLALRMASDTSKLSWSNDPKVTNSLVVITDDVPHGLGIGKAHDQFPNGDPDLGPNGCGPQLRDVHGKLMWLDPFTWVRQLVALNVTIHTVKVGNRENLAFDVFMKAVARFAKGRAMHLDNIANLGEVIAGVSMEDACCAKLASAIVTEMETMRLNGTSQGWNEDEMLQRASNKVANTLDAEEFVSVDVPDISLDEQAETAFRSLSCDTTLADFRTAIGGVHPREVLFTTDVDDEEGVYDTLNPKRASFRSLLVPISALKEVSEVEDASVHHARDVTEGSVKALWRLGKVDKADEMDEEMCEELGAPVYRSVGDDQPAAEVYRNLASSPSPFRRKRASASATLPTPVSSPSVFTTSSAMPIAPSVRRGITPALLARAVSRVSSST